MSLDSFLTQTATINRPTASTAVYGGALGVAALSSTTPCRLTEKRERVWSSERAASVVVTAYLMLVPASADILERDQVEIDGVTYTVTAVLARNARAGHHKSVTLERVS